MAASGLKATSSFLFAASGQGCFFYNVGGNSPILLYSSEGFAINEAGQPCKPIMVTLVTCTQPALP